MKRKKVTTLLLCGTMTLSMAMAACGSTSSNSSSEAVATSSDTDAEVEEPEAEPIEATALDTYAGRTLTAELTAVEDSTITVETVVGGQGGPGGEMPNGEAPSGEMPNGEAPSGEMPDGEPPAKPGEDNADADASETDGEAPSGEMPDGEPPAKPGEDNADADTSETNGEAPSGEKPDGEPPAKPGEDNADADTSEVDGEAPNDDETSADSDAQADGEAPSGEMPDGEAPDMNAESETLTITLSDSVEITDAEGNAISLSDIESGNYLSLTFDDDGYVTSIQITEAGMQGGAPSGSGAPGGSSSAPTSYTAVNEYTTDASESGNTYTSTGTDENAIYVTNGANVTIEDATVTRTSDDSTGGDNASFYGVGASVLNTDGTLVVKNSTITSDAAGGAGVFSYGDGVTYVSDTTINTTQNTSGGIHVAGGGTLYAWNLDVTTAGTSAAAIRSDRGSGTMVVDGGTYTSNGSDSPAVYCTADIAINDATLISNGAEGVCIEGLNSLHLYDSDLVSSMTSDERNELVWNIIVYQSMSGDSEEGNGTFSMTGGSITAKEGGLFYTTNTESTFYLNDVDITYPDDNEFFLRVTGNSNSRGWGTAGANGSDTTFTADNQDMEGDIIFDSISNLDFYMENGSTLKGAFIDDESNAGNGGNGEANLYISSDSTWTVTGDSVLTNLYNEGTIVDEDGNTVTIVDTNGNVLVQGTGEYKITVSSYSTTADFSGATTGGSFSDYAVEQI